MESVYGYVTCTESKRVGSDTMTVTVTVTVTAFGGEQKREFESPEH
jgi:hypothetical protein